MMKITNKFLKETRACQEGITWFDKNKPFKSDIDCIEKLMKDKKTFDDVGVLQNLNWSNWLICRIFTHKQKIEYAVFSAEQVLNLFEKKHPEDKRPRKATEAAKKVLKYNSAENRAVAAAYAAYAADDDGTKEKMKILKFGLELLKGENDA